MAKILGEPNKTFILIVENSENNHFGVFQFYRKMENYKRCPQKTIFTPS